jgi:hypothetical protein
MFLNLKGERVVEFKKSWELEEQALEKAIWLRELWN